MLLHISPLSSLLCRFVSRVFNLYTIFLSLFHICFILHFRTHVAALIHVFAVILMIIQVSSCVCIFVLGLFVGALSNLILIASNNAFFYVNSHFPISF